MATMLSEDVKQLLNKLIKAWNGNKVQLIEDLTEVYNRADIKFNEECDVLQQQNLQSMIDYIRNK